MTEGITRVWRPVLFAVVLLFATDLVYGAAASVSPSPAIAATLVSVAMVPLSVQMVPGSTLQVYVQGTYSDASTRYLPASSESFHSSNSLLFTVSASGLVTVGANAVGGTVATISATDNVSGLKTPAVNSTLITVRPTLVSIGVSPLNYKLLPGATLQLSVLGTLTDGSLRRMPVSGETFHSGNPILVSVDAAGVATLAAGAAAGATATIAATDNASGLVTSTANSSLITVMAALTSVDLSPLVVSQAPGRTWQLNVTGTYNNGATAPLLPAKETFSTSDTSVATVSTAGIVTVAASASAGTRATISVTDNAFGVRSTAANSTVVVVAAPGKPPLTSSAVAASATANDNALCVAIKPFYWEIGDKNAALVSGSLGTDSTGNPVAATTQYSVASASKWMYGAYVAQWRGGAAKLTAEDINFLHFKSGYTNMGGSATSCTGATTVTNCLTFRNSAGILFSAQDPATVGLFDYDGGHMENHAALTLAPLANVDYLTLGQEEGKLLGSQLTIFFSQPLMSGGVYADSNNYGLFLRNILQGSLYMHDLLGTSAVCTRVEDCPTQAAFSPIPESWHYSIGHWVEDDPATNGDGSFSSPGAYGFYPWINKSKTYYGIISRENTIGQQLQEGYLSAQCGRLIRAAWMTGVEQTGAIPN